MQEVNEDTMVGDLYPKRANQTEARAKWVHALEQKRFQPEIHLLLRNISLG